MIPSLAISSGAIHTASHELRILLVCSTGTQGDKHASKHAAQGDMHQYKVTGMQQASAQG